MNFILGHLKEEIDMLRIINRKELITLAMGGGCAVLLALPVFYSVPLWAKIVTLLVAAYVVYLTLRLAWVVADPRDSSVVLKPRVAQAQTQGLCAVCGKNRHGRRTIKVGYRRAVPRASRIEMADTLLLGEGMTDDIHMSVPVRERCAKRFMLFSRFSFFVPVGLDMSFRVLRRKPGYLRGMRHPFEPSNLGFMK